MLNKVLEGGGGGGGTDKGGGEETDWGETDWGKNRPVFFLFFFFIWVLRPFQEYFTYIEPIVHRRWAKTGEPGEKPPDHP